MISERSIRHDMEDDGYSNEEIEKAVADYWESKIADYESNKEFDEAYPL